MYVIIKTAICSKGNVSETLIALRKSPASAKYKVKFLMATDGYELEAEELNSSELGRMEPQKITISRI